MAQESFMARVIGIPHIPSITQVNVRSGPGTNYLLTHKIAVGVGGLEVLAVEEDAQQRALNGKIYQWFKLNLPDGEGWIRDDLISVTGDGSNFGYTTISQPVVAYNLHRKEAVAPVGVSGSSTTATAPTTTVTVTAPQPTVTVAQPTTPVAAPGTGPGIAAAMGKSGVNARSGPGTNYGVVVRMNYLDAGVIQESAPGEDGKDFLWVKLVYQGQQVWAREDYLRYTGSFQQYGVASEDQYPSPAPQSWWIRDFDMNASRIGTVHHGWDHAGERGAPILAGPHGGVVYQVAYCQLCGPTGLSTVDKGFSLSDQRVLRNQGWNFGYGHYVIVKYENSLLPASTRQTLHDKGFPGGHIFVMYAHLQDMLVEQGQQLQPNQQIGSLGNSGNSSGPHLHLEVRASATAAPISWASIVSGLMNPSVLYLR